MRAGDAGGRQLRRQAGLALDLTTPILELWHADHPIAAGRRQAPRDRVPTLAEELDLTRTRVRDFAFQQWQQLRGENGHAGKNTLAVCLFRASAGG